MTRVGSFNYNTSANPRFKWRKKNRTDLDYISQQGFWICCIVALFAAVLGAFSCSESTVSYEGDRSFPATGKHGFLHPFQEAPEAERRLRAEALPAFDELLILRFKATNAPPFPFEWHDYNETRLDYAAVLSRISARYQQRF